MQIRYINRDRHTCTDKESQGPVATPWARQRESKGRRKEEEEEEDKEEEEQEEKAASEDKMIRHFTHICAPYSP